MNRLSLVVLALGLATAAPASAGLASIPLGSAFTSAGSLPCSKTTDGQVLCSPVVDGVTVQALSSTLIRFEHQEADVVLEVEGTGLLAQRGTFANGHRGVVIRGAFTGARAWRSDGDGVVSMASMVLAPEDGVVIDIVATGFAIGPSSLPIDGLDAAIVFDRSGMVLGGASASVWSPVLDHGPGLTKVTGANGIVRVNRGGVLVDPTASSTIVSTGAPARITVDRTDELGGQDIEIVSSPTLGQLVFNALCTNENITELTLTLFDRSLRQAVIGGQSTTLH